MAGRDCFVTCVGSFLTIGFVLILLALSSISAQALIIDHNSVGDFNSIPPQWIQAAKSMFNISYGHTSHGSQLVTGMQMLSSQSTNYSYTTGSLGFLCDMCVSGDLGNPDRTTWATVTRNHLNGAGRNRNVIIWSWCGQVDGTEANINTYLSLMNQLEMDFPNVKFIYMTGHLTGTGPAGNVYLRNNQIRNYALANNKILFDFADIESYDPDGNYYPMGSDDCAWCSSWCSTHACPSCGGCAHSHCFNCYNKGKAFWYMMARLAGWDGVVGSDTTPPLIDSVASSSQTFNSSVITWNTNEASDSQVEYGLTAGYGVLSVLDSALVTSHRQSLSGLSPLTTYHYRVRSRDSAGNLALSGDRTFTTATSDTTPPSIIGGLPNTVLAQGTTTAILSVETDEIADCRYSTTGGTAYASMQNSLIRGICGAPGGGNIRCALSANLTGFVDGEDYHYYVRCVDAAGNVNTDDYEITFSIAGQKTYYVSPAGSDSNNGLTRDTPWRTLAYATSAMPGGAQLILMDGTYIGPASDLRMRPKSGSADAYTVIKAENDGGAIIDGTLMTGEYDYPLEINNRSYIQVEGLSFRNKSNSAIISVYDGYYVKILRTSVINKLNYAGSNVFIGGDSHHVLLEDVWVTGAGRYGVIVLKPTAYLEKAPHQIILRRVVTRHDYRRRDASPAGDQVYPICGVQIYGEQSGDAGASITRDVVLQNNIALDFNYGDDYYQLSGGLCEVARSANIKYEGSIVLNIKGKGNPCLPNYGCSYGSTFAGFAWDGGGRLFDGGDFFFVNNVAWDTSGTGFFESGGRTGTNRSVVIDQNTVGWMNGTEGNGPRAVSDAYADLNKTVKNNLFYETGQPNSAYGVSWGKYQESYNWYYPALLQTPSATESMTTIPDIRYITITPDVGTGEGGKKRGATIRKRIGADGSLWGDPGWDQTMETDLWPWPYEDRIKREFSESNNPQANSYPATNNVKRGFCADGNGLYGGSITLTSYIWEYLGNPCPEDVCGFINTEPGDINSDGHVNIADLQIIVSSFGRRTEDSGYDPVADVAAPFGMINLFDLMIVIRDWGQ